MKSPKLFVFDCDGTLRVPGTETTLMPRVRERLARIDWNDAVAGVASNQEGVASGQISLTRAMALIGATFIEAVGTRAIDWPVAVCPHAASARCLCRKPSPFMLSLIMQRFDGRGIAAPDVLMVGDRDTDREAARRAGIDFAWAEDFFR